MSDLISRADAIDTVKHSTAYMHDDLYEAISRIPSAETTGALDDAIAKYVADGYMLPPSGDLINRADAIEAMKSADPKDNEYHYYKHIAVKVLEEIPSAEVWMPLPKPYREDG